MTDPTAAPDGAGATALAPVAPAAEVSHTPSDLGRMLASLRHAKAQEAAEPAPEPTSEIPAQAEIAAPAEPAPGEPTVTAEPAEVPPIEPPRSWTKEAKDRWQSLPRETQEYLATREQERDREVRRSQNEAAEQRKAIEAQREQAERARQQYEAKLPALMEALQRQSNFSDIRTLDDVKRLQAEDPFRFQAWQVHQMDMQAVDHEMRQAQERQSQEQNSKWTDHVQKEEAAFLDSLNDADKGKLQDFKNEAPAFLEAKGFSREELTDLASGKDKLSIYDRRVQSLILDGIKFQAAQKANAAAKANLAQKPVPPVQRPGVARPQGAANAEALQNLTAKLETSRSPKDLAAVIGAMRGG